MNILFTILNSALAGHTVTSAVIAKSLQSLGHNVIVLIGKDAISTVYEKKGLPFERTRYCQNSLGNYPRLRDDLARLTLKYDIDLVHCFEGLTIAQVVAACRAENLRCFFTLCGGPPQKRILTVRPTIALSEEGKDNLLKITKLADYDVMVIPARVDVDAPMLPDADKLNEFRSKYGVPSNARIVLRIARIGQAYITGILQTIDAVAQLHTEGHPVFFVHIGFVEDSKLHTLLKEKISAVNSRCGKTIVITAQDEAMSANDYLDLADIVIGVGRSAFEGMALSKPVIVMGKESFAGIVCPEEVTSLAHYNFSGRNAGPMTADASILALTEALKRLLADKEYYTSISAFCRQYAAENLSAAKAAKDYVTVYEAYSGKDYPKYFELLYHFLFPIEIWKMKLITSPVLGPPIIKIRKLLGR